MHLVGQEHAIGIQETWAPTPGLPEICCMVLNMSLSFSGCEFSPMLNERVGISPCILNGSIIPLN